MNRRGFLVLGGLLVGGAVLGGCQQSGAAGGRSESAAGVTDLADPARLRVAEAIISSFENSSTAMPYASAQDIGDGRGITAGRAGFTSGTHDLLLVVQQYEASAGGERTPLTGYLPALIAIDASVRDGGDGGDTSGLEGFEVAWRQTSQVDPRLDRAQDDVYRRLYLEPAMAQARAVGLTTALGQLVVLDSAVQHGTGSDPDGLATMIAETTEAHGSEPQPDRSGWLEEFLEIRRAHLLDPADEATTEVWRRSVPRVDTLETLLDEEQFGLETPLDWTFAGQRFHLP
jgi:chitosanase